MSFSQSQAYGNGKTAFRINITEGYYFHAGNLTLPRICGYTKTKFPGGADVQIYLETLGDWGVICWMADFENLATLELAGQILDTDEGYQERLKAASDLFLQDTFDKVYSSVE